MADEQVRYSLPHVAQDLNRRRPVTVVVGWLLVFSGVAQTILAFQVRDWGGFFLHLLEGLLEFVVGVLLLAKPAAGALVLTLLIAAYLLVGGMFRIIGAFSIRFPGWGWVAFAGFVSVALGAMLVAEWPFSGIWFLGTWVGIDLIFQGAAWTAFGLALRNAPPTAAAPEA
jgi:uncharacterized membrane protein HdeD (DUF308 family)